MARNSRDLFEVLGAHLGRRSGQNQGDANHKSSKSKGRSRSSAHWGQGESSASLEVGRRLTGWLARMFGGQPQARSRARMLPGGRPVADSLTFGRTFVAAVVVISLTAGFLAGRWTEAATSSTSTTSLRSNPTGQVPGPLDSGDRGVVLSADQEVERLSRHAYRVCVYPLEERAKASRLTRWLISQGVRDARLLQMKKKDSPVWVVVCYVANAEDRLVFNILKTLSAPSFEPRLGGVFAKLNPIPHPVGA